MIPFFLSLVLTAVAFAEPIKTTCPVLWNKLTQDPFSLFSMLPGKPAKILEPPAPPPPQREVRTYAQALDYFAELEVPLTELAVGKPSTKVKDVPFGKFFDRKEAFDYASVPLEAKKLTVGHDVFFGRGAKSVEDAKKIVTRYFTEGVERSEANGHFDIYRHQSDSAKVRGNKEVRDSAISGFSNGSEVLTAAESFARIRTTTGIVFVFDVKGQEILNLVAWNKSRGDRSLLFSDEKEIVMKGGRSPQRVRAAIIYENGEPVAIYTNPNYQPSGGAK